MLNTKVKLNFAPLYVTKSNGRIRGVASLILNLGTIWRWMISVTTRSLYPRGEGSRYPLESKKAGRFWKEKCLVHLPGMETRFVCRSVAEQEAEINRWNAYNVRQKVYAVLWQNLTSINRPKLFEIGNTKFCNFRFCHLVRNFEAALEYLERNYSSMKYIIIIIIIIIIT
jgi:hypothetical protein